MDKEFNVFCDNVEEVNKKLADICAIYLNNLIIDDGIHATEKSSGIVNFFAKPVALIIAKYSAQEYMEENIDEMAGLFRNLVHFYVEIYLNESEQDCCTCS